MSLSSAADRGLKFSIAHIGAYKEIRDILEDQQMAATFVVGSEAAEAITVNVQLQDGNGNDDTVRRAITIYVFADANGDVFNASNYTTIAAGTDGDLIETAADKVLACVTEADGDLDVVLTITGAATSFLAVVLPGGKMVFSAAITHA